MAATRSGVGGIAGQPRPKGQEKFVVDFAGGPLDRLSEKAEVIADINVTRGTIAGKIVAFRVAAAKCWRASFDIKAEGSAPVDLRGFLRLGEDPLTETWLYQHFPGRI